MRTIPAFFSNWFARWKRRDSPEVQLVENAEAARPAEPTTEIEESERTPVQPQITQHNLSMYPQLYSYSCTAAVFQAVSAYLGLEVTHARAIRLTRCKPDGASLEQVVKALKRLHRCAARRLARAVTMRRALRNGAVILAGDRLTYSDDHSVLIFGCTDDHFLVLDPAASSCKWKRDSWIFKAGDEFIAVWPKRSRKHVQLLP